MEDPLIEAGAAVAAARHDVQLVRRLATRGEAGAADVHACEWRLEMALRALDRAKAATRLPWLFDDGSPLDAA